MQSETRYRRIIASLILAMSCWVTGCGPIGACSKPEGEPQHFSLESGTYEVADWSGVNVPPHLEGVREFHVTVDRDAEIVSVEYQNAEGASVRETWGMGEVVTRSNLD